MGNGTAIRDSPTRFWTREYLLEHCEGFRVSTPDAHVGFVEAVLLDPTGDTPTALAVRGFGDVGVIAVSTDCIAEVRPEAEEIVLAGDSI